MSLIETFTLLSLLAGGLAGARTLTEKYSGGTGGRRPSTTLIYILLGGTLGGMVVGALLLMIMGIFTRFVIFRGGFSLLGFSSYPRILLIAGLISFVGALIGWRLAKGKT